jgi:KUP system potassium uptake protein
MKASRPASPAACAARADAAALPGNALRAGQRVPAPRPAREPAASALVLGSLGVVFGDIGTSPIYALRQGVMDAGTSAAPVVMGTLSMMLWAIVIVVMLKYACYVMRADNEGEGGIIALSALVKASFGDASRPLPRTLLLVGLFGAAMFYGDSMLTPAVSVLSAVEGLRQIDPHFGRLVVPLAALILIALFLFQRRGTGVVGRWFGPVMALWFLFLAATGVYRVAQHPRILAALSPAWALRLVVHAPGTAFVILGAVILALTGAEALYADIGHFGTKPIRIAWLLVVFPSIVLGYFGQGATILFQPGSAQQPFFHAVPHWALMPGVALAMLATVIASQAVISGAFSMTSQAIELGFMPRLRVVETSRRQRGRVYVPAVNAVLFAAVLFLVLTFRSSAKLTSAYGIAVALTMFTTTLQMVGLSRHAWKWPVLAVAMVALALLALDGMLIAANVPKIVDGGWFPLSVGLLLFALMTTWYRGRQIAARSAREGEPLDAFLPRLLAGAEPPARVPGTAVYPGSTPGATPPTLHHNVRHNRVLHRTSIVFANLAESAPRANSDTRLEVTDLGHGCFQVVARHGFVERPNLPALLQLLEGKLGDWRYDPAHTTYFLPRDEVIAPDGAEAMARWRHALFAQMSFHSASSAEYYGLAPESVIEMGAQVAI